MLMMDETSLAAMGKLGEEVVWLETNFPDKTALAALARTHLNMLALAGGRAMRRLCEEEGVASTPSQPFVTAEAVCCHVGRVEFDNQTGRFKLVE